MLKILAVMTGGAMGSVSRYLLFMATQRVAGGTFPIGTLTANLLGSFSIGLLWCLFEGSRLTNEWRLFIFTGFLGGFTTFSTFTIETTQLFKAGEWRSALVYLGISNTLGLLLVFTGYYVARRCLLAA
ncbi:MAG TPA: fluoride efflux transporter CrcB [Desulfurivibrionaceae bacterium]|nr:fluoride efflux transporter CrcB [Desulfurivibrionaceae bacterium]